MSGLAPFALIVAVLYGSWIPFRFVVSGLRWDDVFGLSRIGLPPSNLEDLITNLLVYLPVGFVIAYRQLSKSKRSGAVFSVVMATLAGTAVSILAEWGQTMLPARQSSWLDVGVNSIGTFLGALSAILAARFLPGFIMVLRRALRERPCTVVARGLAAALTIHSLFPFDFVRSTGELHASFRRTARTLTPNPALFDGGEHGTVRAAISDAVWFAALGYFLAMSRRESDCKAIPSFFLSVLHGAAFAVVVELAQTFTRTQVCEAAAIVLRVLMISFGAWAAVGVVDARTAGSWRRRRSLVLPTLALSSFVLVETVLMNGPALAAMITGSLSRTAIPWIRLPFQALWIRQTDQAAAYALSVLLQYSILTLSLSILARRARLAFAAPIVAALVCSLAVFAEVLQGLTGTGTPDWTVPILAGVAFATTHRLDSLIVTQNSASDRIAATEYVAVRDRG